MLASSDLYIGLFSAIFCYGQLTVVYREYISYLYLNSTLPTSGYPHTWVDLWHSTRHTRSARRGAPAAPALCAASTRAAAALRPARRKCWRSTYAPLYCRCSYHGALCLLSRAGSSAFCVDCCVFSSSSVGVFMSPSIFLLLETLYCQQCPC